MASDFMLETFSNQQSQMEAGIDNRKKHEQSFKYYTYFNLRLFIIFIFLLLYSTQNIL